MMVSHVILKLAVYIFDSRNKSQLMIKLFLISKSTHFLMYEINSKFSRTRTATRKKKMPTGLNAYLSIRDSTPMTS